MNAYLFTYKHLGEDDSTYCCWKIAKDEKTAFKFAFGKAQKKGQDIIATKRGMKIQLLTTEEHDVSKIFPIIPIQRTEPPQEVSNNADWML